MYIFSQMNAGQPIARPTLPIGNDDTVLSTRPTASTVPAEIYTRPSYFMGPPPNISVPGLSPDTRNDWAAKITSILSTMGLANVIDPEFIPPPEDPSYSTWKLDDLTLRKLLRGYLTKYYRSKTDLSLTAYDMYNAVAAEDIDDSRRIAAIFRILETKGRAAKNGREYIALVRTQLTNFCRYCGATSDQTQLAIALHFLPDNRQKEIDRMFTMLNRPSLNDELGRIEDWFRERKFNERSVVAAAPPHQFNRIGHVTEKCRTRLNDNANSDRQPRHNRERKNFAQTSFCVFGSSKSSTTPTM
jgi:hypothetical protein